MELPVHASLSELGRVASWMLQRYVDGVLRRDQAMDPRFFFPVDNVEERLMLFGVFRRPITRVVSYEEVDGVIARFRVIDDRGRPMIVRVQQHPDHPGRVWYSSMMLDPPGVDVRQATGADARVLRALELATPVLHEGFSVAYDRPDPFAQDRLRPLPVFRLVAEIGRHIVGTHADACHVIHADTGPVPVIYRHHSRIHPDFQGSGVLPAMNGVNSELVRRDGIARKTFLYAATGNSKVTTFRSGGSGAQSDLVWSTPIVRAAFECRDIQGRVDTAFATAADSSRLAGLFEMTFRRCALWPHGGQAWLDARMSRSPKDYSWPNVVTNAHACVGVWDAGWTIMQSYPDHDVTTRVATILDWAFDPDHPDALEDCLTAARATAHRNSIDRLFAYYGPGVPGTDIFEKLAGGFEQFTISSQVPEPADAADRAIYVDPIYF